MTDAPKTQALTIRERTDKIILPIMQDISAGLPPTISPERFKSVFVTAATMNQEIFACDATSLRTALLKCAADGLVPDGRQAALVPFNTKINNQFVKIAQYMPMVQGIIARAKDLGDIRNINSNCVYENDRFILHQGDDDRIEHTPAPMGTPRGEIIGAYAIFIDKDGQVVHREVMDKDAIDKTRNISRAKDSGPWSKWSEEMSRKTVIRRGAKYIPMSDSLRQIIERDDELVDLSLDPRQSAPQSNIRERLKAAGAKAPQVIDHIDNETGEVVEQAKEPATVERDPFEDDGFPGDR